MMMMMKCQQFRFGDITSRCLKHCILRARLAVRPDSRLWAFILLQVHLYIAVSSAQIFINNLIIFLVRSLIQNRKMVGLRREPCGMSASISWASAHWPLTTNIHGNGNINCFFGRKHSVYIIRPDIVTFDFNSWNIFFIKSGKQVSKSTYYQWCFRYGLGLSFQFSFGVVLNIKILITYILMYSATLEIFFCMNFFLPRKQLPLNNATGHLKQHF